MAEYKIVIENQTIPVPEDIGADDDNVRRTLAPFFPDAANAMITRTEKEGVITINVVKRAGTKGIDPIANLVACAGGRNPAIVLYNEINEFQDLDPERLLALNDRIDQAIADGDSQAQAVIKAQARLEASRPQPAPVVVLGF